MSKITKWVKILGSFCWKWWGEMSGSLSIPFYAASLYWTGSPKTVFSILAYLGMWAMVISIIIKNRTLSEVHKIELLAQGEKCTKRIEELEKTIELLKAPRLEIEGITRDVPSAQKHLCQIRISNKSATVTADNVKVELIAFKDELENSIQEQYLRPQLPVILVSQTEETTINPGSALVYRLFHVMVNEGATRDANNTEWVARRTIIAYFTPGQTTQHLTQFFWKKDYRIKLRVTARDFSKIEQEFNLTFPDCGRFCQFTLTKI